MQFSVIPKTFFVSWRSYCTVNGQLAYSTAPAYFIQLLKKDKNIEMGMNLSSEIERRKQLKFRENVILIWNTNITENPKEKEY